MTTFNDYVILSNDEDRSPLEFDTRVKADQVCAQLNAETDQDTKFWVEFKA